MTVTSRRRRTLDRAIAVALTTVLVVVGLIIYLRSDIRAADLQVGPSQELPTPGSSVPQTLGETWRAPTDPDLGAVISPGGVVVTTTPHGFTGLDAGNGTQRWSYNRSNRDLCGLGSPDTTPNDVTSGGHLSGITAVYRNGDFCSEVQNFDAVTGERGRVRTSPNAGDGELLFGGNAAGWWSPTLAEVWRYDLVLMARYGTEPNPTNSGTDHPGCVFTDMAIALDQFATIEHCQAQGPNARVTLHFNDPGSKQVNNWDKFEFDARMDVDTGSPAAAIVAVSVHRVLVLVSEPEPALVLYDAVGTEISRSAVDLTAEDIVAAADGRPLLRYTTDNATYAMVGDTVLMVSEEQVTTAAPSTDLTTPESTEPSAGATDTSPAPRPQVTVTSLSLKYLVHDVLGLPTEVGTEVMFPVADGILVLDQRTGPSGPNRTIGVEREGWVGPIRIGTAGDTVIEVRGDVVVALA